MMTWADVRNTFMLNWWALGWGGRLIYGVLFPLVFGLVCMMAFLYHCLGWTALTIARAFQGLINLLKVR